MLFSSFSFVAFFACVLLTVACLPHRWRNACLLLASVVFYATWSWKFLGLIVVSILIDYVAGIAIARTDELRTRRVWLWFSIVGNLAILGFFKYWNFFIDSLDLVLGAFGTSVAGLHLDMVLPLGISFYTLQSLGYTIDVYRRHTDAVHSPVDFALYVGFFPQLVAGPIERAPHLMPQIQRARRIDSRALHEGAVLASWGLFKKVVLADNLARIVDPVYAPGATPGGAEVAIASVGFTLLAYADFSGYTDIARGTARMLGFDLVRNFDTPYLSRDMGEFWRRWHVSLSTWLRDYLFISLGGVRKGPRRLVVNLWLTLFVAGLWHGADGSFVLFGLAHGTLVAGTYVYRQWRPVRPGSSGWLAVLCTFLVFAFTMVAFRADDGAHTIAMYGALFRGWEMAPSLIGSLALVVICGAVLLVTDLLQRRAGHDLYVLDWPLAGRVAAYLFVFYGIVLFGRAEGYEFLYFQF